MKPVLNSLALFFLIPVGLSAAEKALLTSYDHVAAHAAGYRGGKPVQPNSQGNLILEAEEFAPANTGWKPADWGENYYAATIANTFLSRKAFLSAPEQAKEASAVLNVEIPEAGRYLVLSRYEAAYRFETQFKIRIEQGGKVVFERLYGARSNLKIWAFSAEGGLKNEVAWSWGANENIVWEGHEAFAELKPGKATITLIAEAQPEPAARRNIDALILTRDVEMINERIAKERHLPLDGLLTQEQDVWVRIKNQSADALELTFLPCKEHSPYWVHLRTWKPLKINVPAQSTGDWVEVGHLLDTLNDGQWEIQGKGGTTLDYELEFAVQQTDGTKKEINRFRSNKSALWLAYDGNTRYTNRIRLQDDVLFDLVNYLEAQPFNGKVPSLTPIYYLTFAPKPEEESYSRVREKFHSLFGTSSIDGLHDDETLPSPSEKPMGYLDIRRIPTPQLEEKLTELYPGDKAKQIFCVSMGDEIQLAKPPADTELSTPEAILDYGLNDLKARTDIVRRILPNAHTGANYSPHHGVAYLGDTAKYITAFRRNAMTMPWGEDYIWQLPVGTQQLNCLQLALFRSGVRYAPEKRPIHMYVMAHTPGNTTDSWRRLFYQTLGGGATVLNLFEFRPVQSAYTENYVSNPEMFQAVRTAFGELGQFEDIIQSGNVQQGNAALWYSFLGDINGDQEGAYGVNKRDLYIAMLHHQLAIEAVDEEETLKGALDNYSILYLTDRHVSTAASQTIAAWVKKGGKLFATAGAGSLDEKGNPNEILQTLLGVREKGSKLDDLKIVMEKQDLPFVKPLDQVSWKSNDQPISINAFGAVSQIEVAEQAQTLGTFGDGSAAIVSNRSGSGETLYCAFLPGLSYFQPAMPLRPVDRGSTNDALSHFLPTGFDPEAFHLIGHLAGDVQRSVKASDPLVQTAFIKGHSGTAIVLSNWTPKPVKNLEITVNSEGISTDSVTLASGSPVKVRQENGKTIFSLDLPIADAIILR